MNLLTDLQYVEYENLLKKNNLREVKKYLLSIIPEGTLIYKYFRGIRRDWQAVIGNKVWMSNAAKFNDPYDCAFLVRKMSKDTYPECERAIANEEYWKQQESNKRSLELQNCVCVTSFSEDFQSQPMWGYYASDNRGICVGYDLRNLIEKYNMFPVLYKENIPLHQEIDAPPQHIEMLTKAHNWKHEREWRIVEYCDSPVGNGKMSRDDIIPKVVYLGCRQRDTQALNSQLRSDYDCLIQAYRIIGKNQEDIDELVRKRDQEQYVYITEVLGYKNKSGIKVADLYTREDRYELRPRWYKGRF